MDNALNVMIIFFFLIVYKIDAFKIAKLSNKVLEFLSFNFLSVN